MNTLINRVITREVLHYANTKFYSTILVSDMIYLIELSNCQKDTRYIYSNISRIRR